MPSLLAASIDIRRRSLGVPRPSEHATYH